MREFAFGISLLMFCPHIQITGVQALHPMKISGFITDADNHLALPGVSVTAIGDKAVAPTITDDNGLFILELASTVQPGSDVWVKFEKQGYVSRNEHLPASSEVTRTFRLQATTKQKSKSKSTLKDPENRTQPPGETHGTTDSVEAGARHHGADDAVTVKVTSAQEAFSVAVETRLLVPGPSITTSGTGFWALGGVTNNCYLSSVDTALFIRIKNLQPTKVMITAYNVLAIGGELLRLKMNIDRPFLILGRGQLSQHSQSSVPIQMPVPSGNLGSFVMFPLKDADPSSASPIEAEFLDNKVGEHYLQPGDSVRGWAFFQYPNTGTIPAQLQIKITDNLGHTYSYKIPDENGNPAGDALRRLITLGPTIDLSSCAVQAHRTEGTATASTDHSQAGNITEAPCSVTQIGGVANQAITTCGTLRSLTLQEKTEFVENLRKGPPGIATIWAVETGQSLGTQIYDALKAAGWQMQEPEIQMMLLGKPMHEDIDVFVRGEPGDSGPVSTSDPTTVPLMHALSTLTRFKSGGLGRSENLAKGVIKVTIGPPVPN